MGRGVIASRRLDWPDPATERLRAVDGDELTLGGGNDEDHD